MAAKNFTQEEIQDLATALDTHIDYCERQQSYKNRPKSVAEIYEREASRYRALKSKVTMTQ